MTSRKSCLTLLELMIVIAVIAIAGGGIFWRLNRLIELKRTETDIARLRSTLLSSRMLAINTKADWQLEIQGGAGSWAMRLVALEEPGVTIGCGTLSPIKLRFGEIEAPSRIVFHFSSTGQVTPAGVLQAGRERMVIPAMFRQEEGGQLGPLHPDELSRQK